MGNQIVYLVQDAFYGVPQETVRMSLRNDAPENYGPTALALEADENFQRFLRAFADDCCQMTVPFRDSNKLLDAINEKLAQIERLEEIARNTITH